MSLLQELDGLVPSSSTSTFSLKSSDSSDAGKTDVVKKPIEIKFASTRNAINADGEVTGGAVSDYLERAAELNDEIDTIPFGLETDDGDIVKVYVNATEADKFEEAMKKLLGVEDDVEEAINKLAVDFDIVDVVWPKNKTESEENSSEEEEFDSLDDEVEVEAASEEFDELSESNDEDESSNLSVSDLAEISFGHLFDIVGQLSQLGTAGVAAATGLDRFEFTKHEMIKKYVTEMYQEECEQARANLEQLGAELPYWLTEQEAPTPNQPGDDMSIGTQFLARLAEAKDVKKEFAFDRGIEAMKKAMRTIGGESDFADKIAETAAMCGLSGQYLNKPEVRESIVEGASTLRGKPARVRSFLAVHSALTSFHGVAPAVVEAKEEDLEGNAFQQLIEEVLVSLGVPEELVSGDAKAGAKAGLKRMSAKLRGDSAVRSAFITFARYAGIKVKDGVVGEKKIGQKVEEDFIAEAAERLDPVEAARKILSLLGVDFNNEKMIRVVNSAAFERSLKTAARNPKVKAAMAVFLQRAE